MGAFAFLLWELNPERSAKHLSRFYGHGPLVWAIYKALNDGWLVTS